MHPPILPHLDPKYAAFHGKHIAHVVSVHALPWHPRLRKLPIVSVSSPVVRVGAVRSITVVRCKIRAYTLFAARQCKGMFPAQTRAIQTPIPQAIVQKTAVSPSASDYRFVDALTWIHRHDASELGVNLNRIAVGGMSRYRVKLSSAGAYRGWLTPSPPPQRGKPCGSCVTQGVAVRPSHSHCVSASRCAWWVIRPPSIVRFTEPL